MSNVTVKEGTFAPCRAQERNMGDDKYGHTHFDKPLTEDQQIEEEGDDSDEYGLDLCSKNCCDEDCECDDCVRCALTGQDSDSYGSIHAA